MKKFCLYSFAILSDLSISGLVSAMPQGCEVVPGAGHITQNGANIMVVQTTSSSVIN